MARPLRIDFEGGVYHVISRGWEGRAAVRDDQVRWRWLERLDRVARRCVWRVVAWALMDALMDNNFHLSLRTPRANL